MILKTLFGQIQNVQYRAENDLPQFKELQSHTFLKASSVGLK